MGCAQSVGGGRGLEKDARIRKAVAGVVPLFVVAHCDLSDPNSYADADLFVDVFVRFLYKHIPEEVAAFRTNLVTNAWLLQIFLEEVGGKVVLGGWCEKVSWTQHTFRHRCTPTAVVGVRLKPAGAFTELPDMLQRRNKMLEEWKVLREKPVAERTLSEIARCAYLGKVLTSRAIPCEEFESQLDNLGK